MRTVCLAVVLVLTLLISPFFVSLFQVFAATPSYDLPTVTIIYPKAGAFFGNSSIFLEFDVKPPANYRYAEHFVHGISYRIDEVRNLDFIYYNPNLTQTPLLREFHGSLILTGIGDGVYTLRVLADYVDGGPYLEGSSPMVSFTVDTTPPKVSILSPKQEAYNTSRLHLLFTLNEPAPQMAYCLDDKENVTLTNNATLTGLPNGRHSIVIYATDKAGNVGKSEEKVFDVVTSASFSANLLAIVIIVSAAVVSIGLLAYFVKAKKNRSEALKEQQAQQ